MSIAPVLWALPLPPSRPGQQATPRASRAMPVTWLSAFPAPATPSPNSTWATSAGSIISTSPVAASRTAARPSNVFIPIALLLEVGNSRRLLAIRFRGRRRFECEGQLVDLPGERERHLVAILHHHDPSARVLADVKGFVLWECDRGGVLHGMPGLFLAVHVQHACTPLAQTCTVGLEVKHDGVFPRVQLGPPPRCAFEVEQIIEEHHLAPAKSQLALAQEQTIAAEAPAFGDDH